MSLKVKDTYRVQTSTLLTEDMFSSFLTFYQPLIGGDAVLVYFTLLAESRVQKTQSSHTRLCALMNNIPIDSLERARMRLEEYKLLKSYRKEGDVRNNYIYVLLPPLTADSFVEVNAYMGAYHEVLGQVEAENSVARFVSNKLNYADYKDVTAKVKHIKNYDVDYTVNYTNFKPKYNFDIDTAISFDYEKFLAITSPLVFPSELRTSENMAIIGRLATLYDISPETMKIFVSRSVNMEAMSFDVQKLKYRCENAKPEGNKSKDPYAISPVSFLQARQNGAEVTLTDKRLLASLAENMHFSNEVINVLVEYVLKNYDNKLSRGVVDKIAGQWARNNVKTKQDALNLTKQTVSNKKSLTNVSIQKPQFFEEGYSQKQVSLSDEEKAKIRALQKKMGDKK